MDPIEFANRIVEEYIKKKKILWELKKIVDHVKEPEFKKPRYCVRCGILKDEDSFTSEFNICDLCFMTMPEKELKFIFTVLSLVPFLTPETMKLYSVGISKRDYTHRNNKVQVKFWINLMPKGGTDGIDTGTKE